MIPIPVDLPTLERLGASITPDLDVNLTVSKWFGQFSSVIQAANAEAVCALLAEEDCYWRDILALTWDFRTLRGLSNIRKALEDRLAQTKFSDLVLRTNPAPELKHPYPGLAWIQAMFDFKTYAGNGTGVVRIVPSSGGQWKAYSIFMSLDGLNAYPEKIGVRRSLEPFHDKWLENRKKDMEYRHHEPTVVTIGGGQAGLEIAARLKHLEVPTLVIEKRKRIGDQWRERYESLCLHDPVWYDHMPYLPFPPSWPVFTPAHKLGDWLEIYAQALEINVWTSSEVQSVDWNQENKTWTITVLRHDTGETRVIKPKHVVFALGVGSGHPKMPTLPGMSDFHGTIVHSTGHRSSLDYVGKKAVVVGACTSAHDICQDFYRHGVDVTMVQRGPVYVMSVRHGVSAMFQDPYSEDGPPTDIADRLVAATPYILNQVFNQRMTANVKALDAGVLAGLEKVGFKLGFGVNDAGVQSLYYTRGGGYYFNVGASELIAEGKIKLKSGSPIKRFTKTGLEFEDGTQLDADVVVFATGFADHRKQIRRLCGDKIADQLKTLWGLDAEGELQAAWRDSGHPGLWYMLGNLALCRLHSTHLALQIKALETGLFTTRYSIPKKE